MTHSSEHLSSAGNKAMFTVVRWRGGKWKAGNCLESFCAGMKMVSKLSIKHHTSGGQACDQEAAVQ